MSPLTLTATPIIVFRFFISNQNTRNFCEMKAISVCVILLTIFNLKSTLNLNKKLEHYFTNTVRKPT